MFKKSKNDKTTYGIVGLGRFGQALAEELYHADAELLVIDRDEEKVRELRELTENAYVVKTLDKKTLSETGIQNCDVAVVCIGEHMDTSILTTLNLVSLGIPLVVSKATSSEHGVILSKLGAEVVYPERDMAIRLAHRLETSRMLDFVQLSEKLNITKFLIPKKAVGRTVLDINLRSRLGLNIIAIEKENKNLINNVAPDYIFEEGDILYLAGDKEGINKLTQWAES